MDAARDVLDDDVLDLTDPPPPPTDAEMAAWLRRRGGSLSQRVMQARIAERLEATR